jgi:hypothetical protein
MPARISRATYAQMFGPTTGDKVRLADTELFIEVEKDLTVYGEEVKFGGGKVIRDGMGQSQLSRAQGAMDTVITNALILDHTGIYKADVGLMNGRIAGIGKAGNPDTPTGRDDYHWAGYGDYRRRRPYPHSWRNRFAHSLHFTRSRWKKHSLPASPAWLAAALVLRMARLPRPARPGRGTLPVSSSPLTAWR